jgi:uncharacterized membrane protein
MVSALSGIAALAIFVLVGAPLVGWPGVVRLPAVLVPAVVLGVLVVRPWRWDHARLQALDQWFPSPRVVWLGAAAAGALLFWIVITRFYSGDINAVDFTVYFDRPCYQTVQGHPLYIEASDDARFSNRGELSDHAYWAMFPICALYAIHPGPEWLLAISVLAVVLGASHILHIVGRLGGGVLGAAAALAFVLNDNTARTLMYGFHPEVLYAWFIPWMLDAGLRHRRWSYLAAAVACVLVKESACLPIFAATAALGLTRFRAMRWPERGFFIALPNVLALANLAFYYGWVVPRLTEDGVPTYSYFWENYGATPLLALVGMAGQPWRVLADTASSGFFTRVITPHLFLPLVGWKWMAGTLPLVMIFGSAAAEQVRAFGIYYAIPLVPFLVVAAAAGAMSVARRAFADPARARIAAAAIVLLGALLVGSGDRGYSLRPWKAEVAAVPGALASFSAEPVVLIQSGLFPHAGYDTRFRLLTPDTLIEHPGAPILLAPRVNGYPFEAREIELLAYSASVQPMAHGLLAVAARHHGTSHKAAKSGKRNGRLQ